MTLDENRQAVEHRRAAEKMACQLTSVRAEIACPGLDGGDHNETCRFFGRLLERWLAARDAALFTAMISDLDAVIAAEWSEQRKLGAADAKYAVVTMRNALGLQFRRELLGTGGGE